MKQFLLVLSLAVLGTGVASANSDLTNGGKRGGIKSSTHVFQQRPTGTPQERADRLTATMKEELNLTAEQATKVQEINLNRFTEMQEMRQKAQASAERGAMREQMGAVREKYGHQMKAVLTQDQYARFEANQERSGPRAGQRPGPGSNERSGGNPHKSGKKSRTSTI
jgi:periplasmic protein CpxP/Spy